MPRIDFAFGAPHRLRTACEVVQKHVLAGRRLLIYCSQAPVLSDFDKLLWGFEATAFVPHVSIGDPLVADTPVILCPSDPRTALQQAQAGALPWLVNLDPACPPGFEQFDRVLEIVSQHDADRQSARERWRQYAAAGFSPNAYDLTARGN